MRSQLLKPMRPVMPGVLPSRSMGEEPLLVWEDPAILAVTDFARERPVTVDDERQIDDALSDMIHLGVRALIVVDERCIVGLITSYDIQGERPMQFLQSSNFSRHQDIRVGDIMTPWDRLTGVEWRSIQSVCVGDLWQLFEDTGLTHLIVTESPEGGSVSVVRGLISRTRLTRQLGKIRCVG